MKLEYSQRNFLRLVPAALLGRYFTSRGVLREIDWDAPPEGRDVDVGGMGVPWLFPKTERI